MRLIVILIFSATLSIVHAQNRTMDSIIAANNAYAKKDSIKVNMLLQIARFYRTRNKLKGMMYADSALQIASSINNKNWIASSYNVKGIIADSLRGIQFYRYALAINEAIKNTDGANENIKNIGLAYSRTGNFQAAADTYKSGIAFNEKIKNKKGVAEFLLMIGQAYYAKYNFPKALEYYFIALKKFEEAGDIKDKGSAFSAIGSIYMEISDPQALKYLKDAVDISENHKDEGTYASDLVNLGDAYFTEKHYAEAYQCFNKSLGIFEKNKRYGRVVALTDIAIIYEEAPDSVLIQIGVDPAMRYDKALTNFQKAMAISRELNDTKGVMKSMQDIGGAYIYKKEYTQAREYMNKARLLNEDKDLIDERDIDVYLSEIFEGLKIYDSAYIYYKQYIIMRDSIVNADNKKEILRKEMNYVFSKKEDSLHLQQALTDGKLKQQELLARQREQELELKQASLDLSNQQKESQHLAFLKTQSELSKEKILQSTSAKLHHAEINLKDKEIASQKTQRLYYIGGIGLMLILSFFIYQNFRNQRKANRIIKAEKQKSDDLLLNILPAEVAEEIKQTGAAKAKNYSDITVLFTDFVNFTGLSEQLTAEQIVNEIDECFKAFDAIIGKYKIEKIKTIGDSYMAAAGLPTADAQHAINTIKAAQEMGNYIKCKAPLAFGQKLEMRIGINSGSVVAGIVGVKKFAYDIWGDTVNIAACLEQHGEAGRINISSNTYEMAKGQFQCEYRGKIQVKNNRELDMYFIQ